MENHDPDESIWMTYYTSICLKLLTQSLDHYVIMSLSHLNEIWRTSSEWHPKWSGNL